MTGLGQAAVAYAERYGWSVFPLANGEKKPRKGSRGCHDATRHLGQIDEWWDADPHANIGIGTGAVSGLVVLDVDPRHSGDDSLAEIQREHGAPPDDTPMVQTPHGWHLYYGHPGGHVPCAVGLWPGLDVRADGGYVVAPPSVLADGGRYEWEATHHPDDVPLAPAPEWLLARLRRDEHPRVATPPSEWRTLVNGPVPVGRRNDTIARLAGYLLHTPRNGVDPYVVLDLLVSWNRDPARCPVPLADDEVTAIVNSLAKKELHRRRAA